METTFTRVCLKSDWVLFHQEKNYEVILIAWKRGLFVDVINLFGTKETINGSEIASLFISTKESRIGYEKLEQMLEKEVEEAREGESQWRP